MEYALEAVKQGSAAVGLRSKTHSVLLALKVRLNDDYVCCLHPLVDGVADRGGVIGDK